MLTQPVQDYSFEDYLAVEREAIDEKHEYVDGQVFAMTGASYTHNLIVGNLLTCLNNRLAATPCAVLPSDMRLRIETANACLYPDITVLCEEPTFHDKRQDVLINPLLTAEILSPSTEAYDRGGKFALYRQAPSLRHYLLIAQDRPDVNLFTHQPDGRWVLDAYRDTDAVVTLPALACEIRLSDIYAQVVFASDATDRPRPD